MNDFEKVLAKEIVQSLNNNPELWDTCIVGLRRNDGLELILGIFESIANVSVYKPYQYDFKDEKLRKEVFMAANKLQTSIYKSQKDKDDAENRAKLADFLNLNTRKNKLQHLNDICEKSDEEIIKTQEEEQKKEPFFKRLFNYF